MTTTNNTTTNNNIYYDDLDFQDGTIFTYWSINIFVRWQVMGYSLDNNYHDEKVRFEDKIREYDECYQNFYGQYEWYNQLFHDPFKLPKKYGRIRRR